MADGVRVHDVDFAQDYLRLDVKMSEDVLKP
jgi:hypothetical protein